MLKSQFSRIPEASLPSGVSNVWLECVLSVQCHLSVGDLHGDMNITLAHYCFFLPRPGSTVCPLGSEGQLHTCWVLVLMAVGNLVWMHGWWGRALPTFLVIHLGRCFWSPSLSPTVLHVGVRSFLLCLSFSK